MSAFKKYVAAIARCYTQSSLILRIVIGLVIGAFLGVFVKNWTFLGVLGDLFVGGLKAMAPILVFVIVSGALAQSRSRLDSRFGTVLFLYLLTTLDAAVLAVFTSFAFPQKVALQSASEGLTAPQGLSEVFSTLLSNLVANPFLAITNGNYIGILFWAVLFGLAMKRIASEESKTFMVNVSDAVSQIVRWIIGFAPFGICGLVYTNVSTNGLSIFQDYGKLLALLVGTMLLQALVIAPFIAFLFLHRNPYPLLFRCLRESGVTAFFTRSSAANIPVNMALCEKLELDKDMYSVAIPLGATINMDGAAITITVMTLAAANTLGIQVSIPAAIVLSFLSALGACGASGVAGGSLLLIPMACSLFGISNDVAMQVVAVGFIIGVVQDSVETALNSSGDVMFAATADYAQRIREGKPLPEFMQTKKERAAAKAQS
ncbi:MAG: serine/threonine transporter SstT [Lachnospiraceae bacterium]|jgi:serine/threonine transporter|nr:serine/threonine transporter SstT [Lachnospiraceae bacterium]MCI1398165.1 serine/threonine transporter SstT [Lachnospiraceae bacterium]MCI1424062.1 serine/threonine transporter SstT [Lachnospiraceae bacterium]MCI1452911.1 serine/threonine transporter SstT [Lachnospiraceae bacterium]